MQKRTEFLCACFCLLECKLSPLNVHVNTSGSQAEWIHCDMCRKVVVNFCESIQGRRISFHKRTLSSCSFACSLLFLRSLPSSLIRTCCLSSYQNGPTCVLCMLFLFLFFLSIKPQIQQFTL